MRLAIAILILLAGPARADRASAERLAREARTEADETKFVACGHAYLAIYNADPSAANLDETLYNAAVCFEDGKAIGAALQAFAMVRKLAPRSKLMPRVIARLGRINSQIGFFDKAAELYEDYATRFAGEHDAVAALSDAIYLRSALGDDTKLAADVQFFIRTFGRKRPAEAAQAHLALLPAMERKGPDAAIAHLREHLRQFARVDNQLAIAIHARLGELLWQKACPVKGGDGLCVKAERRPATRMCGPAATARMVTVPRDARLAREATSAFRAARTLAERNQTREPAAVYYAARAQLALADAELERYLAVQFPAGLDFDPKRERPRTTSLKRFDQYVVEKSRLGKTARDSYEGVLMLKDGTGAIAAAARLGQLSQAFARQLMTAEIPRDVQRQPFAAEKIDAFCDQMAAVASPLAAQASTSFDVCAAKASELGVFDDFTRLCHRERELIDPSQALRERFARPVPGTVTIPAESPLR
jgi:hypothetical protein